MNRKQSTKIRLTAASYRFICTYDAIVACNAQTLKCSRHPVCVLCQFHSSECSKHHSCEWGKKAQIKTNRKSHWSNGADANGTKANTCCSRKQILRWHKHMHVTCVCYMPTVDLLILTIWKYDDGANINRKNVISLASFHNSNYKHCNQRPAALSSLAFLLSLPLQQLFRFFFFFHHKKENCLLCTTKQKWERTDD